MRKWFISLLASIIVFGFTLTANTANLMYDGTNIYPMIGCGEKYEDAQICTYVYKEAISPEGDFMIQWMYNKEHNIRWAILFSKYAEGDNDVTGEHDTVWIAVARIESDEFFALDEHLKKMEYKFRECGICDERI